MKICAILVVVLICGTLICGCTSTTSGTRDSSSKTQITTAAPTGPTVMVSIRARAFDPSTLPITVGTTVIWKNEDSITHHVVHSPDVRQEKLFDSGQLSPGQSFSYTFTEIGQYEYSDPQIGGSIPYRVIVN